jgi:hypothetical protein
VQYQAEALALKQMQPPTIPRWGVQISAQTTVNNSLPGTSDAIAAIGQPISGGPSSVGKEAVAYGDALPLTSDAKTVLASHPVVNHDFDLGGNSQVWMLGNMAVLNTSTSTALHDYHSMLNLSINTASISNPQDVLVGLLDPLFGTNNFLSGKGESLTFSYSVSGAGGSNTNTYTFNAANINTAPSFFNDKTLDLGSLASLVNSNNKMLSLVFNLDLLTETQNAGLNFGLIVGNSTLGSGPTSTIPLPTAAWLFLSGLLGFLGLNKRKKVC